MTEPVSFKRIFSESEIVKEVEDLKKRPEGWKAGLDINTTNAETYVKYTKTTDKIDFFGKGFGGVKWNNLGDWGDEEYYGGVSVGFSW